jgi:NAD(P)H-dependent flavin oxidoreductase YrpB (nitropropane dioxygenase family)
MSDMIEEMPRLIQAGMGVHISCARLAQATSRLGALGVVSGVGLRHIVAEQIRQGDTEAIEIAHTFPIRRYVDEMLQFAMGGARHNRPVPMDHPDELKGALPKRLSVIASYVEVMRARKGHRGKIGINVMWKCALTVLPTIYGAMLAGVDALLCGAGVPMELPDIVKKIRSGVNMEYAPLSGTGTHAKLNIEEDNPGSLLMHLKPPKMIPILSNFAFPKRIMDIWERQHDGIHPFAFVLEHFAAGGHNAPPRNRSEFGDQDDLERYFDKVREMGVPVYVAGSFPHGGSREDYLYWRERGAYGIQVGSRFALCEESGMRDDLKGSIISANTTGNENVGTSKLLSPTGYPFKYYSMPGTLTDPEVYEKRKRICNRGYLTESHFEEMPDGTKKETYICPAMPPKQYINLGGKEEDMKDRVCLCNALLSTAGYYDDKEPALITLGVSGQQVQNSKTARQIVEDILTPEYVHKAELALALK